MPWFCTINSCLQKIIIFLKYHAVQKILNLREEYVVHITEWSPPGDYFVTILLILPRIIFVITIYK